MALNDLLNLKIDSPNQNPVITEEQIKKIIPVARQYIAFWSDYPDLFVDFMAGKDSKFHFYFYQRVFLRAAIRHQYLYAVFPRALIAAPIN